MFLPMLRKSLLLTIDGLLISLSLFLAFEIRFEGHVPADFYNVIFSSYFIFVFTRLFFFYIFHLYDSLWRYVSIDELFSLGVAASLSSIADYILNNFFGLGVPRSVLLLNWILTIMLPGGFRLAYRIYRRKITKQITEKDNIKRILIIGAGDAGSLLAKELVDGNQTVYKPILFLDDAPWKNNTRIYGIPVKQGIENLVSYVEQFKIDEVIVAIPSLSHKRQLEIMKLAKSTKCKVRTLPGTNDLLDGKISINTIRDVEIEDLLGRDEVKLNLNEIAEFLKSKTILVTGAGGSIGSELCRQILKFSPKLLVLVDISENSLYDLQFELRRLYPNCELRVLIASVRDRDRIDEIFGQYKPEVVFHAAAHKHVPLMEDNPFEAIKNNVFGTFNVVESSHQFGVGKFVLISTDKAVNPTNVMGASKRIAEMIVQSKDQESQTEFVAVRFGNVLGSNGSVIPLFKKQIALGGPITVTHPDITRFFMTIPEASRLVLQAGAIANGGEIFVLDMGQPVKIVDLARQLIELSGFVPDVDIEIKFTGLRPGEKLYEELLLDEEGISSTKQEGIFIAKPNMINHHILIQKMNEIVNSKDNSELYRRINEAVPTFTYHLENE